MKIIEKFFRARNNKLLRVIATVMAALIVFATVYSLILPAITIEEDQASLDPGIVLAEQNADAQANMDVINADADIAVMNASDAGAGISIVNAADVDNCEEMADSSSQKQNIETELSYDSVAKDEGLDATNASNSDYSSDESNNKETTNSEVTEDATKDGDSVSKDTEIGTTADSDTDIDNEGDEAASMPAITFEEETNKDHKLARVANIKVTVEAEEGTFPEGTTLKITEVTADRAVAASVKAAVADSDKAQGEVQTMQAVDITFFDKDGKRIEPLKEIKVTIASDMIREVEEPVLVHIPDNGQAEIIDQMSKERLEDLEIELAEDEVAFEAEEFSVYAVVGTEQITLDYIDAHGDTYTITVTFDEREDLTDGNYELYVTEIDEDSENYKKYLSDSKTALDMAEDDNISFARFFDIIILKDGDKIEPEYPAEVKIHYEDALVLDEESVTIVHFGENGTEVIDDIEIEEDGKEIVYTQDSFSVIGTVATTNATGWPTSNGQYVIVLNDGDVYYALGQDGSLREIKYFNDTIAFMGEGTTSLEYISNYLWYINGSGNSRYVSTGAGDTGSGTFINLNDESGLGTRRQSQLSNNKFYYSSYGQQYSLSAKGGELSRVMFSSDYASEVIFSPYSSYTANSNETSMLTQEDIDSLIEKWRRQMIQELDADKTAEVYDYENRVYQVDITASSGYYEISPSIALEFVVDSSRSMYFPASLTQVGTYTSTSGRGTNYGDGLRSWLNSNGDTSKTYFTITDPNGSATVYAIFWSQNGWYYVDASNYNPPDDTSNGGTGSTKNVGTSVSNWNPSDLDKKIYTTEMSSTTTDATYGTRGKWVSRIEYLKMAVSAAAQVVYAVDGNAQIGLVSFNASAKDWGTFDKEHQADFFAALESISLAGGTNHKDGLDKAIAKYQALNPKDHQQVVLLVTDGAPNNGATWTNIGASATTLKNLTDMYGEKTQLYTLGLSLDNVGTNKQSLFNIASGKEYQYDAEDASAIVQCITQIIENLVIEANLKGNVIDVIDKAFYLVSEDGTPLSTRDWITLTGAKTTAGASDAVGQVTYDNNSDTWKVIWNNQKIDWPEINSNGNIIAPGWHGTIYLKAKEDFLGGNAINTNLVGSQIEASKFINRAGQEQELPESSTNHKTYLETPYVNVDELSITQNSTEWTVYLGESVDPQAELKKLWENIFFKEVVSKSNSDHTIASDGSMTYTYQKSADDGREEVNGRETFHIGDISEVPDWDDLISQLKTTGYVTIEYGEYGHNDIGLITIALTQNIVSGEPGLTNSAHTTAVVGDSVEKYKLTVNYTPISRSVDNYHTGSYGTGSAGSPAGEFSSTDIHNINVFAKKLQLTKIDMATGKTITSNPATFVIYRTARNGENGVDLTGLSGKYVAVESLITDITGVTAASDYLPRLGDNEHYYLVETEAPNGYNLIPVAMELLISISDEYNQVIYDAQDSNKPLGFDWLQKASLSINDTTYAVISDGKIGQKSSTDSEISVVEYDIKNTSGIELPSTGGSGTLLYTLGGLSLMTFAASMYGFRMRRRESLLIKSQDKNNKYYGEQ